MSPEEREAIIVGALRFLAGEEDEDAEDSYFGLTEGDPVMSWSLICDVATRSRDITDPSTIGAGPLESFIRRYGTTHAEMIADGIMGNSRLIAALRWVNGLHRHPNLVGLLPPGIDGTT